MGSTRRLHVCITSLTSLDCPQKALENFSWPPNSLTRFLAGTGRAFLRDGHRYATSTSDCDCENCFKVALFVGAGKP